MLLNREMLIKICRKKQEDLHKITELNLSDCNIIGIDPNTFEGLFQLEKINLSGNNINGIHPYTYKDLFQLTDIYLHNNDKLMEKKELEFYFEDKVRKITFHCTQDRNSIDKIHNVIL